VDTGSSSGGQHHHQTTNRGHQNTTATTPPREQQLDLGKITSRLHSNTDPSEAAHKENLSFKVQVELIIIYFLQLGYLNSLNLAISETYRGIKLRVKITYIRRNFSVSCIKNLICSDASHGKK
jgi:hypothetical protein